MGAKRADDDAGGLAAAVADLARRVEALEGRAPAPSSIPALDVVTSLHDGLPAGEEGGVALYAGAGRDGEEAIAFQIARPFDDLLELPGEAVAPVFGALASPVRVAIVQLLLRGPATKAELAAALDEPTAGQLYHHLKELLAAGLVHQPRRAVYAVAPQRVVPLLVLLSAGVDAAGPDAAGPVPGAG